MRLAPLLLLLLGACGRDHGAADAGPPDARPADAAAGPDVGAADASADAAPAATTIRVHYDTGLGNRITLRGDGPGLSWTSGLDCLWSEGNVWICALPPGAGPFELKPLVNDSVWARGTNWRAVAGGTLDVYPHFYRESGRLVTHAGVTSALLGNARDVVVYLPPSYDENPAKRYPLLFMHDGQNLFDPSLAFGGVAWEIDAALDGLSGTAGIGEAIVAGVYNTSARIDEYTPTADATLGGGDADLYLRFLLEELRPMLDGAYRTDGARVGLAGSSLGGLVSLYGCWTRPADFDRCGVFSPSLWWDGEHLPGLIAGDTATVADKPLRIYLDSGDSGTDMDGMAATAAMRDTLVAKGWVLEQDLRYVLGVGHTHTESAWAARAPGALEFLLYDRDRVPR